MKNPEEGIEYTVYTHNMHVKRYVIDERITVGSHVKILHRDSPAEPLTEVQTAFYLEKGGFELEEEEAAELQEQPSKLRLQFLLHQRMLHEVIYHHIQQP